MISEINLPKGEGVRNSYLLHGPLQSTEGTTPELIDIAYFYESGRQNLSVWLQDFPNIYIPKLDKTRRVRFAPHMTHILLDPFVLRSPSLPSPITIGKLALRLPRPTHHRARPLIWERGIIISNQKNISGRPIITIPKPLLGSSRFVDMIDMTGLSQSIIYHGNMVAVLEALKTVSDLSQLAWHLYFHSTNFILEP